jgi:hypothetical protein
VKIPKLNPLPLTGGDALLIRPHPMPGIFDLRPIEHSRRMVGVRASVYALESKFLRPRAVSLCASIAFAVAGFRIDHLISGVVQR